MYGRVGAIASRLTSRYIASNSLSIVHLASVAGTSSSWLFNVGGTAASPLAFAAGALPGPGLRKFCTLDVTKEMDAVNELFVEARDEIEFAKEEAETVYFNESVKTAKGAVDTCLKRWEELLAALPEEERNRVVRTMGLKMAQLQAEFDEVSKLHLED
ncbi:hypothetical protein PLESTB_000481400 [Pleodorina starrii]|uniref:Uncharacterized protein n=1 Tax=Pleodorina starrii TaxID=330485 RepID=A0A9W6F0L8_9CHLO|nr:hypothetical protein PLESTM_001585000 [Pleodorina starrii]GLC51241.1 hypothetical protein PLESTB_000481400 [Pleodorina starrii]GLC63600.1 hypothetical protein PLESTF_000053800 [Pleodorina starrii]